jgi:peptide/nickel transport system substrate-binding protein
LEALPDISVKSSISGRAMYIAFDLLKDNGVINNVKVRQALNYAVDKDAIIARILDGYGTKLQAQFTTPQHFGFNPSLLAYPYDVEKARTLLAEAGYPNGFTVDFYTSVGRHARDKEIAEAIVGYLADVGVTANLKPIEWGIYLGMMKDKSASPLALCGMMAFHFDGGMQLEMQTTGAVYSWYSNPQIDALYDQSSVEIDPDKRAAILQEMSAIMREDPPAIWLHQVHYLYAVRDNVVGWSPRPDEMMNLLEVDIKD